MFEGMLHNGFTGPFIGRFIILFFSLFFIESCIGFVKKTVDTSEGGTQKYHYIKTPKRSTSYYRILKEKTYDKEGNLIEKRREFGHYSCWGSDIYRFKVKTFYANGQKKSKRNGHTYGFKSWHADGNIKEDWKRYDRNIRAFYSYDSLGNKVDVKYDTIFRGRGEKVMVKF